jgi:glycosyltransferase involved in cell wall biosynthesis
MNQYNSKHPLVSVVIPAHNAELFIDETLKSVISQTYKNLEVLVVDDGSEDNTSRIVKSFCKRDNRIVLMQQPQSGVAAARNAGIRRSKGEFVAPLDADDVWDVQNIEKQLRVILKAGPSVGLVYAWSLVVNEDSIATGEYSAFQIEGDVYATLLSHYFLGNASAALIRRICFERVGYYSTEFKERAAQGCEDWELCLRIAEHYQFRVVPEFLIGYRRAGKSMSSNYLSMAKSHNYMLESVALRHVSIPHSIYLLSIVNLYIYFAHQSARVNKQRDVRYWLLRAIQINVIVAFLSFRIYTLLAHICLNVILNKLKKIKILDNYADLAYRNNYKLRYQINIFQDDIVRKTNIRFINIIGHIYHRLVLMMSRKSKINLETLV